MKQLGANWLTEGLMDVEYKKYMLLGYLQYINQNFDEKKLYPFLSDLITHYENLILIKQNKELVSNAFSRTIKKIDLENFKIEYEKLMNDDSYMSEIELILDFAIPKIKTQLGNGKEIYETIEQQIKIFPIGIVPLHADAGYIFLNNGEYTDTQVFDYQITIFERATEKYRAIRTQFIDSYIHKLSNTFEAIKYDLIRKNKNLPNPATFVISSAKHFPLQETFFPIAKRSFVRFLNEDRSVA